MPDGERLLSSDVFRTRSFDPDETRERVRGRVASLACLVFLTVVVIYLVSAMMSTDARWSRVKDDMQAIFPAVTSILGTVLGFYFGSQKS